MRQARTPCSARGRPASFRITPTQEEAGIVKNALRALVLLAVFLGGAAFGRRMVTPGAAHAEDGGRVFELRTYTAPDGKLDELHARFRDHTMRIFEKHGMTSVGYWVPQDSVLSKNTIVYILAHDSREAARRSWAAFGQDPEWRKVARESEANGRIVERVESRFLEPTDYSPLK